ncbi:MAG: hypothetical protein KDB68_02560 [Planctomycetes bacterium]|nr:hypothetical protein [Planctomycetota bacterium]
MSDAVADEIQKPLSPPLRLLRVVWAVLLVSLLVFSILMAAWGGLREALMLKFLDARYVKSFTLQVPEGTKVWLGDEYLGESAQHPLAEGEPEDDPMKVEGMSVLLPRVYFYEQQLLENSVDCAPGDATRDLLKRLSPEGEVLWVQDEKMHESAEFMPALLKAKDGRLDFVNLCRVDWPSRDGGFERKAFLLRMLIGEDQHVFGLDRTELWSDQLYAEDGEFWTKRDQWDDYPPKLTGQTKTVWRLFMRVEDDGAAWMKSRYPYEYADASWFRLPVK